MSDHALLSPSSAHRWLNCPLAPRLEAELPAKESDYAKEGSIAHKICEVTAKKHFKKIKAAEYNKVVKKCKTDPLWSDEMLQTAEIYVEHIAERIMGFESEPYLAFEVSVDITDVVPEAFGTCDCVMIGGNKLIITDYKHGKGVPVEAKMNPQMMLYALGALKVYAPIFGTAIKNVEMYIDQPRLNSYEGWACSVEELLAWGTEVKPKADRAFAGIGEYNPGDWCRFCRANGICKAQCDSQLSAFDDFKSIIDGQLKNPALLTPEELAKALEAGKLLDDWYESVQEQVQNMILDGTDVPGWKVVEGRSSRVWSDQDKALETLMANGIERAIIYDNVPKSLAQLEKVLGTAKFAELVGKFVQKPAGKPTLVPESDKRKPYNSAAMDFAGVGNNEGGQSNV